MPLGPDARSTAGGAAGPAHNGARSAEVGSWGAPFAIGTIGIHSTVLPGGRVLLFSYPGARGTRVKLWDPRTQALTDSSLAHRRDLFCSGHSLLPDGRVFVTGGTVYGSTEPEGIEGVSNTDVYDPATGRWRPGPRMTFERWYPTNVTLSDGRVLIFSGLRDASTSARFVDVYDPSTGSLNRLPRTANKELDLYPRMHVLPDGRVFWAGEERGTWFFDPATNRWSFAANMSYGARYAGTSVLLPGLERVLALGGARASRATASAEVIDLSDPTPTWRATAPMHFARIHPNAVLLADGTVLVVGGGRVGDYQQPEKTAELFDPSTGTWKLMDEQTVSRMYHSTAVLLPDGRVLSAGQDHGRSQSTAEIFSPPYLFAGPRPVIDSAPTELGYGAAFHVDTPDAARIARVALVRPGSATHSVNFEQRYVDLSFTVGSESVTATAPPDGNVAPPGWYMLFVVDARGVPSVATWVHVA